MACDGINPMRSRGARDLAWFCIRGKSVDERAIVRLLARVQA
jgi:hypothetical protein